jgi:hypothetical protein
MIHGPFVSHDMLVFLAPYATQRGFISKKICLVQYAFTFLLGINTSIVLGDVRCAMCDVRCCLILYVARIFTTLSLGKQGRGSKPRHLREMGARDAG